MKGPKPLSVLAVRIDPSLRKYIRSRAIREKRRVSSVVRIMLTVAAELERSQQPAV